DGIVLERVEPKRNKKNVGRERRHTPHGQSQSFRVAPPIRSLSKRQVEVEPFARSFTGFFGESKEVGKGKAWIGVYRDKQHVVSGIEDRLRAVAVVIVDVEDCDPKSTVA